MHWLLTYIAAFVTFLILDAAWIFLVSKKQYELEAGEVLRDKPKPLPGVLFYLLYVTGICIFAALPLTRHFDGVHAIFATYRDVAGWGFGLGVFAYSSFSLTNQAVIKDWKWKLAVADLLWGGVVTAVASLVAFAVFRALA